MVYHVACVWGGKVMMEMHRCLSDRQYRVFILYTHNVMLYTLPQYQTGTGADVKTIGNWRLEKIFHLASLLAGIQCLVGAFYLVCYKINFHYRAIAQIPKSLNRYLTLFSR